MPTLFDPNSFMETSFAGNMSTEFVNVDEGDYPAQIKKAVLAEVDFSNIGEKGIRLSLDWEVLDEEVKRATNMEHPQVQQQFLLDFTIENGRAKLDFGVNKNMRLKRLLDAVGLNKNKAWAFNQLVNLTGYIKVKHENDRLDATIKYARVASVVALEVGAARKVAA